MHIAICVVPNPLTSNGALRIFGVASSSIVKHYQLSLRGFEVLCNDKSVKNVMLDEVDIKQELFPLYNRRHVVT
jgi:hypothetical protein